MHAADAAGRADLDAGARGRPDRRADRRGAERPPRPPPPGGPGAPPSSRRRPGRRSARARRPRGPPRPPRRATPIHAGTAPGLADRPAHPSMHSSLRGCGSPWPITLVSRATTRARPARAVSHLLADAERAPAVTTVPPATTDALGRHLGAPAWHGPTAQRLAGVDRRARARRAARRRRRRRRPSDRARRSARPRASTARPSSDQHRARALRASRRRRGIARRASRGGVDRVPRRQRLGLALVRQHDRRRRRRARRTGPGRTPRRAARWPPPPRSHSARARSRARRPRPLAPRPGAGGSRRRAPRPPRAPAAGPAASAGRSLRGRPPSTARPASNTTSIVPEGASGSIRERGLDAADLELGPQEPADERRPHPAVHPRRGAPIAAAQTAAFAEVPPGCSGDPSVDVAAPRERAGVDTDVEHHVADADQIHRAPERTGRSRRPALRSRRRPRRRPTRRTRPRTDPGRGARAAARSRPSPRSVPVGRRSELADDRGVDPGVRRARHEGVGPVRAPPSRSACPR